MVADSGLMNNANIAELEARGYKYIIGAKIKNESQEVKDWILEQPKLDCQMVEYDKGGGRRLLVGSIKNVYKNVLGNNFIFFIFNPLLCAHR